MGLGQRILIVEDDAAIRESLTELLEEEGYEVIGASNGADALAQLKSGTGTRLILLDLRMPVMDGWEFRAEQRHDPRLARIPVVIISADHGLPLEAGELGVEAYLAKPFGVQNLLETVRHFAD